ncbi:MAG: PIN domain-containing protein [Schwartzia sp.]|nr:PIN domain-containing protein [Schwartzia sp. (in: firmicutes)]MBR1886652.1 PIN domain-containing protein [Schwartzia sp. (in: firmicutes)]
MRLYLDCCCYNRPFDAASNDRIHDESEAVLSVINRCRKGAHTILGSSVLRLEIDKIRDPGKKGKVQLLYSASTSFVPYTEEIKKRAEALRVDTSIRLMDSLHLASAEAGKADIFLTTDDKLIRGCKNIQTALRVLNPVAFLAEVIMND